VRILWGKNLSIFNIKLLGLSESDAVLGDREHCDQNVFRIHCGSKRSGQRQNAPTVKVPNTLMNKQAIAEAVQGVLGGTKVQAEQAVDMVVDSIINTLKKGGEVSIAGLGIFSVKQRAARQARNPRTGEAIQVAAMKVPKFRAAKAFKDAVK